LDRSQESFAWVRSSAAESSPGNADHDFWGAVRGIVSQFDGLLEGSQRFCPGSRDLSETDLLLLNLNGDLFDIIPALRNSGTDAGGVQAGVGWRAGVERPAHCSAAVRLVPSEREAGAFSDLLVGHATWDTFSNAFPRIFKHVTLPVWRSGEARRHTASFSSSPGFLSSIDDFYSISGSASLFVQETSIGVLRDELYRRLSPQTVPCFLRAVAANRLARDGKEWARIFSTHHSGTYADQWMVVDRSRFAPGRLDGASGLLWVVEEAPGRIAARDMTSKLISDGYWASYNIPFFAGMRSYMGYEDAERRDRPEFSFERCVRARLFRELLPAARSLEDMQWVMRWNDFREEPISNGDPLRAIAARGDLSKPPPNGRRRAFGAIDSKVSSWRSVELGHIAAVAVAGPTREQQPPFCWTDDFMESHQGHPRCFNGTRFVVPKGIGAPRGPPSAASILNLASAPAAAESW